MVAHVNRQILLKSRPEGARSLDNFTLKQGSVPEPGDGEVLMRTRWLSLDPYMRGRMSAAKSYAKSVCQRPTSCRGRQGLSRSSMVIHTESRNDVFGKSGHLGFERL